MNERPGPSACYAPRVVEVSEGDIARLEWATGRERIEFVVDGRLRQSRGACVFLSADGICSTYGARPEACEDVPKHLSSLRSEPSQMSEPAVENAPNPEALRAQLEALELAEDQAFEAEYRALCEKRHRRIVVDYRLFVERMK